MLGQGACHWHAHGGEKLGTMLPSPDCWNGAQAERDSAPTSSLICDGLTPTRERHGNDFSLASANKGVLECSKLAKTNQTLDKGERPQTPAILAKRPEQGLCRNGPLHSAHVIGGARPHTPALLHSGGEGEQGHQVPSSWPSPLQPPWNRGSAGRADRHSPGAGRPEQAAAHAPRGHPSEERCLLLSDKCHTLTQ